MANAEHQAVRPPQEGEQGESDGLHTSPWQIASAFIGAAALFAALAVFMGYLYLRTYLEDLGIPGRVLTFTPYQYALASSPLVAFAGLYSVFAVSLAALWGYGRQAAESSRLAGLLPVAGRVALVALLLATGVLFATTALAVPLSHEVLPHLSPGGLKALIAMMAVALALGIMTLPVILILVAARMIAVHRLRIVVLCAVFLLWAVAFALPVAIGHIDARLTLDVDEGTQRATLLLVSDAGVEGPWGSAEDGRIENAQVIFICEDYIYFLYRSTADADSPTVHAIAADLVSRIDFFPER